MAFIRALILCLISPYAIAQDNWQLVWSDEFNGNQIDSSKWEHEVNGWGGGNNELQYYTDRQANSWVENGFLNIRALQEQYTGPDGARQYTSARLRTLNKGDWKYGRIIVRAKLPEGQGLWPAIWMLPTDWVYGGWASSGEIDIMEAVNLKTPNNGTVHGTLHYGGEWPRNVHTGDLFTPNQNPADSFHDYEIQWEEGEIRWYVDGQHFQTQTDWHSEKAPYPAPFDQRFHLLLNVAVGGNWPGSPNNSTRFPQTMQVDYVRVYQSGNGSENSADEINIADQASNIVATVTSPQGGGNRNIEIIRDGKFGRQGSRDSRLQYDTYDRGTGSQQEYIGYEFTEERTFSKVVFIEGKHFWDGGYFIDDLHVEVKNMNGVWEDVATDISPAYPYRNDREFFDKYTLSFEPTSGFGVRITGLAGGNAPFISVSELEVFVDSAANNDEDHSGNDDTNSSNDDNNASHEEERNLETEASEIIATVTSPRGGGNRNIEIIRDGQTASIGSNSSAMQYDTFDFGRGSREEYIGYIFDVKYNFTEVIFTEGRHFHDGGWFQSDLHVEVQRQPGGSWERVAAAISPAYPHRNNGQSYETYTLSLNQVEEGYGIRIQGLAGGNAPFISVSELAVKGSADNGNDNSSDSNGNDGSDSNGSDNSGDVTPTVDSPIQYTNSQGYRVTRFGGRVRDRHAREDFFHAYQHFVPNYFRNRTFGVEIIDRTPTGQSSITFNVTPEHDWVNTPNFRAFFTGVNTVAEYHQNMGLNRVHNRLWTKTITFSPDSNHRIDPGEMIEFEIGVFMQPDGGRTSYYSRAFLYHAGQGGLEPWAPTGRRGDSEPLPQKARTGGDLTISVDTSDESDQMLMQLALNIAPEHAQPFVEGRRIHHSDLSTGNHSEGGMGNFGEMRNKVGPHFINTSCANCHEKNGKADHDANDITNMVFKTDDPEFGSQIQTRRNGNIESEATINRTNNGFSFSGKQPNTYSARTAPSLIGVGLIDAIADETLMELADPNDEDGDGISGKARIVFDPVSGTERVGRFGWQAGAASLRYQIAAALNGDMGVTSLLFPELECGSSQITCNQVKDHQGIEMSDANMDRLEVYNALLGVPPRRNFNDGAVNRGEAIFREIGCNDCHVEQIVTGDNHKFPELNNQTIMPYSDFLLHDMGEGLAATFAEEGTLNTEWRTAPLWGISRSEDIHGDPQYLHDGRARSLHDAIMWHGGEAEESKQSYAGRSSSDQSALRQFLESL